VARYIQPSRGSLADTRTVNADVFNAVMFSERVVLSNARHMLYDVYVHHRDLPMQMCTESTRSRSFSPHRRYHVSWNTTTVCSLDVTPFASYIQTDKARCHSPKSSKGHGPVTTYMYNKANLRHLRHYTQAYIWGDPYWKLFDPRSPWAWRLRSLLPYRPSCTIWYLADCDLQHLLRV
jgi:hypothetical protein